MPTKVLRLSPSAVDAGYTRLSLDREGDKTSPERQWDGILQFQRLKGLDRAQRYNDVNKSAYHTGVVRPEYEQLITDIQAGRVRSVTVWKLDRLARSVVAFVGFVKVCEEHGVRFFSVSEGFDTTTPFGNAMMQILAVFAELEAATIGYRVGGAWATKAKAGGPHVGGLRAFGFADDRETVVPEEAEMIREAVRRLLAGESLRHICQDWNSRGLASSRGNEWRSPALGRMLRNPRLSGVRTHLGTQYPARWESILSQEEHGRILAHLGAAGRNRRPQDPRVHLLTGTLVCGRCGKQLKVKTRAIEYGCVKTHGCGGVSIRYAKTNDWVSQAVLAALADADLRSRLASGALTADALRQLRERLKMDRDRLDRLTQLCFVEGKITEAEYFAARDPLAESCEEADRLIGTLESDSDAGLYASLPMTLDELETWWTSELTDEERRAWVQRLFRRIVVQPAIKPGRHVIDWHLRLAPVWRVPQPSRPASSQPSPVLSGG